MSYWQLKESLRFIKGRAEWPEGEHVHDHMRSVMDKLKPRLLLDYGCGKGRFADTVNPENYIGYDINDGACEEAAYYNPGYTFTTDFPTAKPDVTLLYTVISMVSDEELPAMLSRLTSETVIIGEIIGRDWANHVAIPCIYNRDLVDIQQAMSAHGYTMASDIPLIHDHYCLSPIWGLARSGGIDGRIHILTFHKVNDGDR